MLEAKDMIAHVGGGDRELSEGEQNIYAERLAEAANANLRWQETRSLEDRFAPRTVTVTAPGEAPITSQHSPATDESSPFFVSAVSTPPQETATTDAEPVSADEGNGGA